MNKAIAGFHILSILSVVDNNFDPREGLIIVKYLKETYNIKILEDCAHSIGATFEKI